MDEHKSIGIKICDRISKFSIFATIFLMPIFFLPWTADVLDFNKQTLLILLGFVALFAWMIKVLVLGKLELNFSKIHIVVGVLFLIYLLATIFSLNKYGSFWGWPQVTAESLLSLIGLVIFYFLVGNTFSKKNIFTSVTVLFVSALVAEIAGFFLNFNTIGSVGSLGFFVAILLPLAVIMLIVSKKWWKILFAFQILISALILFSMGYSIVWWVVLAGSAVVIIFGIMKRNLFDGRWMILPMFFLAVSIFFILLNPQIPWISKNANEIFLSQGASFNISLKAIKENPIFGSGPGTFSYDFLKFKDLSFSQSTLWSAVFNQAGSKFFNDLASVGVLGLVAFLAFMVFPIFCGVKFLAGTNEKTSGMLVLGILSALLVQAVMYFLYNSNLTLIFLNFFMLACIVEFVSQNKKEYELKPHSLLTIMVTIIFTLLFIFGFGVLILDGQRYAAEVAYASSLSAFQAKNITGGTKDLELAASLNSNSDLYFSQLSQVYLGTLQNELKNATSAPSADEKTKIQNLISNSVNAAKIATNLNPNSSSDWSNLGYVYQSLNGIIGDSSSWSLGAYDSALAFDPNNPYLLSQEGVVNFVSKNYATAQSKLEKTIGLNPNYSNALYYLGLVYNAQGQKDKAIQEFTKLQQLNPKDTTIPQILSNLNAGLPAMGATPAPEVTPTPTPASTPQKK